MKKYYLTYYLDCYGKKGYCCLRMIDDGSEYCLAGSVDGISFEKISYGKFDILETLEERFNKDNNIYRDYKEISEEEAFCLMV